MAATDDVDGVPAVGRIDRVRARAGATADTVQRRVPQAEIAFETRARYRRLNGPVLAGHLAFRTFIFLLPMGAFFVAMAGFASSSGVDLQQELGTKMDLSEAVSRSLADNARDVSDGRFGLLFTAVAGLTLGALGVTSALHYAFSQVWELPIGKIPRKGMLLVKFVGVVVMVMATVLVSAAVRKRGPVVGTSFSLVTAALVVAAFLAISLMLPRRATRWYWLLPGAVVGMLGLLGLHLLAVYYLPARVQKLSAVYGSLGVALALLFYLFVLSNVIILSAFVNASWWDHHHDPDAPADEGGAAADA